MPWSHVVALLVAGLAAGLVNVVAGGGSIFTLQTMMALGLPADVANGTNRLAVLAQGVFGLRGMDATRGFGAVRTQLIVTACGVLGGALFGALLPTHAMTVLLKAVLVIVSLVSLVDAVRPARITASSAAARHGAFQFVLLFMLGAYGGLLQVGIGIVIVGVLSGMLHWSAQEATAYKLRVTVIVGTLSLVVYGVMGKVRWVDAAILALASACGAWIAGRWVKKAYERQLKTVFSVVALIMTAIILWR